MLARNVTGPNLSCKQGVGKQSPLIPGKHSKEGSIPERCGVREWLAGFPF